MSRESTAIKLSLYVDIMKIFISPELRCSMRLFNSPVGCGTRFAWFWKCGCFDLVWGWLDAVPCCTPGLKLHRKSSCCWSKSQWLTVLWFLNNLPFLFWQILSSWEVYAYIVLHSYVYETSSTLVCYQCWGTEWIWCLLVIPKNRIVIWKPNSKGLHVIRFSNVMVVASTFHHCPGDFWA